MNASFSGFRAALLTQSWLIEPTAHAALLVATENTFVESAGVIEDLLRQRDRAEAMAVADGVAEIPINGPLLRSPGVLERLILGATDTGAIAQKIAQAVAMPDVKSILLTINSPGGSIAGIPELAAQVRDAARTKRVVSFTDGMMASAAYWVGAQASEIIASTSASVGSIGVYIPWQDTSKRAEAAGVKTGVVTNTGGTFKGMGYPGTSYTPEQMAHLQAKADELFAMFRGDVTSARRGIKPDAMQGQTFFGQSAKAGGLVDSVGSHVGAWTRAYNLGSGKPQHASAQSPGDDLRARLRVCRDPHESGRLAAELNAIRHSSQ